MIWRWHVTAMAAAALAAWPAAATTPVTIEPDIYLDFECGTPPGNADFLRLLRAEKFHAIARSVVAQSIDVTAYNDQGRSLLVFGPEPITPQLRSYTLEMQSPPPTVHDDALEARIRAFLENDLHCTTSLERRSGERDASKARIYGLVLERSRSDIAHALCDPSSRTYDKAECAALPAPSGRALP